MTVTITDIPNIEEVGSIQLFPNPATTNVEVKPQLLQPTSLELSLLNSLGQLVHKEELATSTKAIIRIPWM
ncbi:MAG: hypothetical protein R2795_03880 [Saprospiraceae bacterium]